MNVESQPDAEYLDIIIGPLSTCQHYKPRFGHGTEATPGEFQAMYQADPFYAWFGLDSPLLYAAHKAAGGMTSLYRQIGIGCQRLVKRILMDTLGLDSDQAGWSYQVIRSGGSKQTLSLDCRIPTAAVRDTRRRRRVSQWLDNACQVAGVSADISRVIKGAVFEVRQGYKSKDSKRQNADIANAAAAYSEGYLPVLLLLSTQIDDSIAERYKNARWLILQGAIRGQATSSTYEFFRQVVGYDLAAFFERNSPHIKQSIDSILQALLK